MQIQTQTQTQTHSTQANARQLSSTQLNAQTEWRVISWVARAVARSSENWGIWAESVPASRGGRGEARRGENEVDETGSSSLRGQRSRNSTQCK